MLLIILLKPTDIKPPFTEETAKSKIKSAQDAWNTCNPEIVVKAYSIDSKWRNRIEFFQGRESIVEFLKRKWAKETRLSSNERALVFYKESYFSKV